jgi:drug/metabolite transporter (DMT)-like permease
MTARWVALAGAIVISFSAILFRLADVSPATAAFFRPAYGLPFLMALALAQRGAPPRTPRERTAAVAAGGLMGLAFVLWMLAIDAIGAGLSTVLGNTQVVIIGLAAWILQGERPTRAALAGVPLVLLGIAATGGLGGEAAYGDAPARGVALGIANAFAYAAFLMAFRSLGRGRTVAAGLLGDASFGAALVAAVAGWATDPGFSLAPAWPAHGWLLASGVGPQVVGWLAILYALPRLPALDTSIILLMQPVLTVAWAWWLLAETPSAVQLTGVGLVLAGVALVNVSGALRARREAAARSA